MNILPPLLLDRSCLVEKMKKLSPVIDRLEWINTNDTAFRAYWSYYANGCKKRQQDIRQRIEQNADFVQHIKSKKAASFLKILTQDKAPLVNDSPANNNHNNNTRISEKADIPDDAIYEQFFECFRTPIESGANCNCNCNCNIKGKREKRKREKPSPIIWQQEAADAWKRLQNSRNPYDIAQIIEQLKRLKQQQSSSQRTPFADRYKNITMKYVARKPLDIVSMPIDISKQKKTKKMRRKPTENKPDNEQRKRRLQRKRRATIPHVKYDYPREQRPSEDEAIKNLLQLKRSTYTEVPIRRDTTPYTKPQRDEASLPQLKSITLKKVAQLYEIPTLPETQEKRYRRSKGRRIKRAAKRVTKRPKQKLNNVPQSEAFQLRTTPTYLEIPTIKPRKVHTIRRALAKVSTKRNKQKPSVKYRSFRIPLNLLEKRERLVKEEAVKVKSWYKEFLKHVKDIPSHILSPHSSAIGSPSLSSKKKKQMQKLQKLIQKYETHYDDVSQQEIQNVIDKLKELEKRNPLVGELIERMQGIQSADSIDSSEFGTPDLTPYQTMDTNRRSILSRVSHLSYKRYSARAKRTKMHSIQSFDIKSNENILRKKRGKKGKPWLNLRDSKLFLETYRKNRLLSTLKQERLSAYASLLEAERQTLQLRHSSDTSDAEDESPVDQLSKSIVSLKTVASKNSSISIRDAQHRPYQPFTRATLSKLNKNYEYRNPYSRASFIGRISDIFGQASIDIQNRLLQQESLPTAATTLPMETLKMQYLLRRQELEPLGQRERPGPTPRDEWNLKEQRSSTPKIEEPKPLYISELVAEFLKNRSIQKIFKNAYPQIFQIQQEAKAKELKHLSLGNQTKCVTRKCRKQHATMKSQPMKPKTCINCAICKQLQSHLNKSIAHPYMLQMQCERKKWELHAYYKQMMLRNCQLNKQHKQQQYTAACCMLPLCPCQSVKLSSS